MGSLLEEMVSMGEQEVLRAFVKSVIDLPKVRAVFVLSADGEVVEEASKPGSRLKPFLGYLKEMADLGKGISEEVGRGLSMVSVDTPKGSFIINRVKDGRLILIEGEKNLNVGRVRLEIRKVFK